MPPSSPKGPYTTPYKNPGESHYHFPTGKADLSPCMSDFWRSQPIRQGKKIIDTEHDEKTEEEDSEEATIRSEYATQIRKILSEV